MSYIYQVDGLSKTYGKGSIVANDDITFNIQQADIFGLLGPNGAGKTTLLKQLLGLIKPDAGSIKLYGQEVTTNPQLPSFHVALMSQRPSALADLTVREALTITGHLRGLPKHEAVATANCLLEELDLGGIAHRITGKLSGGQQRLLSFGLAMTGYRPVMVLDEPTNDLDPVHRKLLWDRLHWLNREYGTTIILVTHNVIEAERVLQQVGIINQGRIMALGSVGELKEQVDQRLRIDIRLRPSSQQERVLMQAGLHDVLGKRLQVADEGYYMYASDKIAAEQIVHTLLNGIGLDEVMDFRITQPTLEDVYLQLSGGEQLVKANVS